MAARHLTQIKLFILGEHREFKTLLEKHKLEITISESSSPIPSPRTTIDSDIFRVVSSKHAKQLKFLEVAYTNAVQEVMVLHREELACIASDGNV